MNNAADIFKATLLTLLGHGNPTIHLRLQGQPTSKQASCRAPYCILNTRQWCKRPFRKQRSLSFPRSPWSSEVALLWCSGWAIYLHIALPSSQLYWLW